MTGSNTNNIDGDYLLRKDTNDGALVYSKFDESNHLYYVADYSLWVQGPDIGARSVKSFTKAGPKKCPNELQGNGWQEKSGSAWIKMSNEYKITCEQLWSSWSTCSCESPTRVWTKLFYLITKFVYLIYLHFDYYLVSIGW